MQATAAQLGHHTPAVSREVDSTRLAVIAGVCGLLANVVYVLAIAVPLGDVATPVVGGLFGPLIAGASVTLYLLLASERPTLAGQLAAVANVAAGALVTAMVLVQISIDDVKAELTPEVHDAFKHVEFGLDLAWDVFLVIGTILFGLAMLADPRFGRRFGVPGIAVAVALYVLNFASFPTPLRRFGPRRCRPARRPVVRGRVGPGAPPRLRRKPASRTFANCEKFVAAGS